MLCCPNCSLVTEQRAGSGCTHRGREQPREQCIQLCAATLPSQVRNAQIAALWDELHTRQPWRNALDNNKRPVAPFADDAGGNGNGKRMLAFLAINTVSSLAGRASQLQRARPRLHGVGDIAVDCQAWPGLA